MTCSSSRNQQIAWRVLHGETCRAVGMHYGISGTRVTHIVHSVCARNNPECYTALFPIALQGLHAQTLASLPPVRPSLRRLRQQTAAFVVTFKETVCTARPRS